MNAVSIGLRAKLVADSAAGGVNSLCTGGIFNGIARQNVTGVYLVYQCISSPPDYTLGPTERHRQTRYQLKAYERGRDYANTGAVVDRLEVLLVGSPLTLTGWTWKSTTLINRFDTMEKSDSVIDFVTVAEFYVDVERS